MQQLSSHDQKVYAEQVKLLYKPLMLAVAATLIAASLFVIAQWPVIDHQVLIGWLVAMTIVISARALLGYLYNRTHHEVWQYQYWGRLFIIGSCVTGIMWGLGSILLFPAGIPEHQMVVALVIIGMCSGAVSNLSIVRRAYLVFAIPALLPVIPLFILEESTQSIIIVPTVLLAFAFFIKNASLINQNTEDNIRLRIAAKEREQQLIDAKEQADSSNKAKSQFLSLMSHELRTPLNAILGFGQILEMDKNQLTADHQAAISNILDGGNHLLHLINEVLDLAKIESGRLQVTMETVVLDELLPQCKTLISPGLKLHNIDLTDRLSGKGLTIKADSVRAKQVILNLLSNATKYNRSQGSIIIDAEVSGAERLRISITDSGQGISGADIDKLFTPFDRLDAPENVEGSGIGLVITRSLMRLMEGDIGVESTIGEGSTFWVEFST